MSGRQCNPHRPAWWFSLRLQLPQVGNYLRSPDLPVNGRNQRRQPVFVPTCQLLPDQDEDAGMLLSQSSGSIEGQDEVLVPSN